MKRTILVDAITSRNTEGKVNILNLDEDSFRLWVVDQLIKARILPQEIGLDKQTPQQILGEAMQGTQPEGVVESTYYERGASK